jgi:hypothetical protein
VVTYPLSLKLIPQREYHDVLLAVVAENGGAEEGGQGSKTQTPRASVDGAEIELQDFKIHSPQTLVEN